MEKLALRDEPQFMHCGVVDSNRRNFATGRQPHETWGFQGSSDRWLFLLSTRAPRIPRHRFHSISLRKPLDGFSASALVASLFPSISRVRQSRLRCARLIQTRGPEPQESQHMHPPANKVFLSSLSIEDMEATARHAGLVHRYPSRLSTAPPGSTLHRPPAQQHRTPTSFKTSSAGAT